MGLVHLEGFQASLACELFRPFFRDCAKGTSEADRL
jgi:hypothetical protein